MGDRFVPLQRGTRAGSPTRDETTSEEPARRTAGGDGLEDLRREPENTGAAARPADAGARPPGGATAHPPDAAAARTPAPAGGTAPPLPRTAPRGPVRQNQAR
ncbi:hypothetical protein GCM10010389_41110 [Streptomyces echinoruber]|uniref:Uncharacterized protein n=1 Tax=Streptomyces echinoruber TaxID=68898 RepID=A0A918RF63_9ACTN|nr:hypothetical protein GCM10010389_41110 [Streptomyces echinoruber]